MNPIYKKATFEKKNIRTYVLRGEVREIYREMYIRRS